MTNEFNSNVRTLIVSFVFAIMFLIPLRFVEVGNMMDSYAPVVLGDYVEARPVLSLPNAEVEAPMLEEPYASQEQQVLGASTTTQSCIDNAEADKLVTAYTNKLEVLNLNEMQVNETMAEIVRIERNRCR